MMGISPVDAQAYGNDLRKPGDAEMFVKHGQSYINDQEQTLRKLFKNPRAKPDGTKMFCSAFLNDARMCCFFANAIVKY